MGLCKCGSFDHTRTSSTSCPLNKKVRGGTSLPGDSKDMKKKKAQSKRGHPNVLPTSHQEGDLHDEQLSLSDQSDSMEESNSDLDIDDLDELLLGEDQCTCKSKAHKIDCPRNIIRRRLFTNFHVGDAVIVHPPRQAGKHLICRIVQVNEGRYMLHCIKGTLSERYGGKELTSYTDRTVDIPLDKWRQSDVISVQSLREDDLVSCSCRMTRMNYITIKDSETNVIVDSEKKLNTLLYSLSAHDIKTVTESAGWLNDNIITASQKMLLQAFPKTEGLQPPTLQQIGGFKAHDKDFVQVINVANNHWCVVSILGCSPGELKVYDTLYEEVSPSIIPSVANLVYTEEPFLKISMVDVGSQKNGCDCGVLAIAIAYDLCAGYDPSTVEYENTTTIRDHLMECLKTCCITRFPIQRQRTSRGVVSFQDVELFCTCRQPEADTDTNPMAECQTCSGWYHRSRMDIPETVFQTEEETWTCKCCTQNPF